ncbi:MAG: class I SAM-dependent methyltransferase, partial [Paracoccus sp. (in: a-proteobacteria)]
MIDPLTRLAILHGTDKFGMHDYTPVYHAHFAALRDRPLRLLEIGVGGYDNPERGGRSLAMWRDYFPNAQIVGFDISEKRLDLGPRVTIRQGSQIDAGFLRGLVADHGPFDIIIDDGSHHNAHVWRSFQMLLPALVPGGVYIVEDVQTAFFPGFGGSLTLSPPNMIRSFGDLMLDLPQGQLHQPGWPAISRIDRQHNMIVVTTAPAGAAVARLSADGAGAALGTGRAALWGGADLAPLRIRQADPALWQDEAALSDALHDLADGEALALPGWPDETSLLSELWAQIDHVERAVEFPHVAPIDTAGQVIQLSAFVDGILLVKGPNDFPSNMKFHFGVPRARTAFEQMYALLSDPSAQPMPSADSLRMLIDVLRQIKGMAVTLPLVRRLAQIGASDDSSVRWA